jgi:hypothetical protein
LNCSQRLLTRLLLLRALLVFDQFLDVSLQGLKCGDERGVAFILNDSTARTWGQVEEGNIDQALNVAGRPRDMIEIWQAR